MRIVVTSIYVDDQETALDFYTRVLGFVKKRDLPFGKSRWLTVVSPDDPEGIELLLEPAGHPAVAAFRKALAEDGVPLATFKVEDCQAEFERLKDLGVRFIQEPTRMAETTMTVLDDTCGNLIQLHSRP